MSFDISRSRTAALAAVIARERSSSSRNSSFSISGLLCPVAMWLLPIVSGLRRLFEEFARQRIGFTAQFLSQRERPVSAVGSQSSYGTFFSVMAAPRELADPAAYHGGTGEVSSAN